MVFYMLNSVNVTKKLVARKRKKMYYLHFMWLSPCNFLELSDNLLCAIFFRHKLATISAGYCLKSYKLYTRNEDIAESLLTNKEQDTDIERSHLITMQIFKENHCSHHVFEELSCCADL